MSKLQLAKVGAFFWDTVVLPINDGTMEAPLMTRRWWWWWWWWWPKHVITLLQKLDADSGQRKSSFRHGSPEAATSAGETECRRRWVVFGRSRHGPTHYSNWTRYVDARSTPDQVRKYHYTYLYKCKKLQFIHKLTASDTSKTAKITKRWLPHQHIA